MSTARPTFPRSNVLILGPDYIQSLVPSTLISQAESLLDNHRIEDAVDLADNQLKKLQANISPDEDEAEELRYVYQRIGFQCFTETLFEDAGKNLFNGDLDPRLLISYYPELRGSLFTTDSSINVFAGVAERMPIEASIEDISEFFHPPLSISLPFPPIDPNPGFPYIARLHVPLATELTVAINLVRNYSPHLSPNTRSAPPTAELRRILVIAAKEMLEVFLRRCKVRGVDGKSAPIVDTVLAKLYAEFEKTQDLYALLTGPNEVVVTELEPVLEKTGQYNALCILYRQRGEDLKLLEVWSKLVEGQWTDEDIKDPLSDMVALLTEKRDRALTQKWGLWLIKRDPERGLKLLMPKDSGKRRERPEEDLALLEQIKDANAEAGALYLEYLVLQRRSTSKELHTQLANSCIDSLYAFLSDDSVSKLWRAKASSYASSSARTDPSVSTSFLSYFASTTPDSTHKRARLKTILLLSGSSLYDPAVIRPRILEHEKLLKLELAILDGKLGNHHAVLSTLVHDMHDPTSAETYCTLGGHVVPPKTALSIAESHPGLEVWTSTLFGLPVKQGPGKLSPAPVMRQKSEVDEELKNVLLKILLEVYMDDGEASTTRAAHLLSSQAMNLDILDVIPLVPPNWSLNLMSSFLEGSFRRTIHACHEGKIVKSISAGQNLMVKDKSWLVLREEGMVIEEPVEGDDDEDDDGDYSEKQDLSEKATLHLDSLAAPPVRDDMGQEPVAKGDDRGGVVEGYIT